jgi:hypothetical protein
MTETIQIVVTDVTIYGKLRCVAGWDIERKRMVRPEPEPGHFWPAYVCGKNTTFHPGHLVDFHAEKPVTSFPHQSEDWVVQGEPTRTEVLNDSKFKMVLQEALAAAPDNTYGNELQMSGTTAYVVEGAKVGSLCGIAIFRDALILRRRTDDNGVRLRAKFEMGGAEVDLSVAAKDLRQAFDREGIKLANEMIASRSIHLRLGLARALDHSSGERRCYLQINGIYPI